MGLDGQEKWGNRSTEVVMELGVPSLMHTERVQLCDEKKSKYAYESLKDVFPESSFVMMAKAVFGSEELEEVFVKIANELIDNNETNKQ